ncbi:MAG: outer membrane protein assembly factor BamA [Candidatus Solibacter usitatus]|nr:outer membrane protein assembly factor BamA [Candidatus Solibacter usitatus]
MNFIRRFRLTSALVCLFNLSAFAPAWLQAQSQSQQAKPAAADPAKPAPPQAAKPANPFEAVQETAPAKPQAPKPQQPAAPEPAKPQLEAPKAAPEPPKPEAAANVIELIEFRGARRVPQETMRAQIFTKKGDVYSEETLHRDFMALWNTGRFDDIRLETEPGTTGLIVRFVLTERRVVRSIKYRHKTRTGWSDGAGSLTTSEILDRFKERKVGLSVESQYDPNKVQRAAVVLKEYLGERGRQFATVDPEVRQIPPSSLEVTFDVNEGPTVKVGRINIVGNHAFKRREVIRAMKNLHPLGIPYSIFFEGLFSRTYDAAKLEEDKERIRSAYQDAGYWTAKVLDHTITMRDVGGANGGFRIPVIKPNKPGKRADLTIPVEEGKQYHLAKLNFVGIKLFRTTDFLGKDVFRMEPGDVFSTAKLRKGIENMKKLYGEFGYIDFVPEPSFDTNDKDATIDLTLTADEGKQFFVRRIDFTGNTTTRDKVIRREIMLDEGDFFNSRLWELSILRLNQLGYFEVLKAEEAATIQRNTQTNTVDITLKVKERGKNSIGLNGGVSGIAGTFVGFNYSTNNFLGLGETLSLDAQLGSRQNNVSLGFTEPYFLDRPLQLGFVVYLRRFDYNQGREASILSGQNLIPLYNQLGSSNLLNYVSNSHGFTSSMSYPLRRSFSRLSLTYGFDVSNIKTLSEAANQYFTYLSFDRIAGPNQLAGIKTSQITPAFQYNTVDHPITPTRGKSLFISTRFAASFLGGNVNSIRPTIDAKYFRKSPINKNHILGFHLMGSLLTGFGGRVAPPFERTYIGGEQDIRGFEIWGVSPAAFIASEAAINVLNADGSPRSQRVINSDGTISQVPATMKIPIYQLLFPGGDTQVVTNFEYRIPIFGPVTLAFFFDAGMNRILLTNQLKMSTQRIDQLNASYPQAAFDGRVRIVPGTQTIRASTGVELQVLLPVVNAPFRVYWAYNPSTFQGFLQQPIVADRSMFPNNATFLNSVAQFGLASPFFEKKTLFRFTIGRTF